MSRPAFLPSGSCICSWPVPSCLLCLLAPAPRVARPDPTLRADPADLFEEADDGRAFDGEKSYIPRLEPLISGPPAAAKFVPPRGFDRHSSTRLPRVPADPKDALAEAGRRLLTGPFVVPNEVRAGTTGFGTRSPACELVDSNDCPLCTLCMLCIKHKQPLYQHPWASVVVESLVVSPACSSG